MHRTRALGAGLVCCVLCCALAVEPLGAQQKGTSVLVAGVADAETGQSLEGAEVVLVGLRRLARANGMGEAVVAGVPRGVQRVRVRRLGYAPAELDLAFTGDTTGAVFRLERSAVQLGGVDVTADPVPIGLKDFERRRKQGIGRFLTEENLARDADRDFVTVATLRFPGLRMAFDAANRPHIASMRSPCGATGSGGGGRGVDHIGGRAAPGGSSGGATGGAGAAGGNTISGSCESTRPCLVQIFLDDIRLDEEIDSLVRTWDLSGAEYYTGASMPARYRTSGSACGVLVLWSKWR